MNEVEFEKIVMELPNVHREESFGYAMFFVGNDNRLPFVTIAKTDNDFDHMSNLERDGVFRLNIGISKETFNKLISNRLDEEFDYSVLNLFLPHPHYAKQHFVCILNPEGDNLEKTKQLIIEAHSIAEGRLQNKKS